MKTYNQFISEIIRTVDGMKNLGQDDIMKAMDIIDKTGTSRADKKKRRTNFLKDVTGVNLPWYKLKGTKIYFVMKILML